VDDAGEGEGVVGGAGPAELGVEVGLVGWDAAEAVGAGYAVGAGLGADEDWGRHCGEGFPVRDDGLGWVGGRSVTWLMVLGFEAWVREDEGRPGRGLRWAWGGGLLGERLGEGVEGKRKRETESRGSAEKVGETFGLKKRAMMWDEEKEHSVSDTETRKRGEGKGIIILS